MFSSKGPLRYNSNYKLIVEVDQDLSDYYRSLIPKWLPVQQQRWPAHISVIRKEIPLNLDYWGKYEGEEVEFYYDPIIQYGTVYYWLNVFCKRLEEIRVELGLPISSEYTRPPDCFEKVFHMTLGNKKEQK